MSEKRSKCCMCLRGLWCCPCCTKQEDGAEEEKPGTGEDEDTAKQKPGHEAEGVTPSLAREHQVEDEAGKQRPSVKGTSEPSPSQTHYVQDPPEVIEIKGEQTEEFSQENKSIVWSLMKQIRPGMDLSKIALPTFILEPRSFLDQITDYYYHADIISKAAKERDPYVRMKTIVKWYLSGFYKKPKGLKKPYNPILGETFRCYWAHGNGSKTFYLAEQVSHDPPISSFFLTNRQDGFVITGTILAKSKLHGNSATAFLEGVITLSLLEWEEHYSMTMPYAYVKGLMMGTMTLERGGEVVINCEETGYRTEMEFNLQPFLGSDDQINEISGQVKIGNEIIAELDGNWDDTVILEKYDTDTSEILWQVTEQMPPCRLKRFTVPLDEQEQFESCRLWQRVSDAIKREDHEAAAEEKSTLEEAQRARRKEREESGTQWRTKYFEHTGGVFAFNEDGVATDVAKYSYKFADMRPWDEEVDLYQYERDYEVCTMTRRGAARNV